MSVQSQKSTRFSINWIVLWLGAVILVGLGIRCVVLAGRFGLWVIMPRASLNNRILALISLLVELTLGLLLILGGAFSAYLGGIGKASVRNLWFLLRPSFPKLVILIILIALSVFALTERVPTSKVTWQENRGVPLAFLSLTEHRLGPGLNFCMRRYLDAFEPFLLISNGLIFYYVTCVVSYIIQISTKEKLE
jgi:hypothetical protein